MTRTTKDVVATALTALAVLAFLATHEGWNVALVGDSHRWAAVAIGVLGVATCALGRPGRDAATIVSAILGTAALGLLVWALASGSLTSLSLLVADFVALWGVSTLRHHVHLPGRPIAA